MRAQVCESVRAACQPPPPTGRPLSPLSRRRPQKIVKGAWCPATYNAILEKIRTRGNVSARRPSVRAIAAAAQRMPIPLCAIDTYYPYERNEQILLYMINNQYIGFVENIHKIQYSNVLSS